MRVGSVGSLLLSMVLVQTAVAQPAVAVSFVEGERIALLGGTFIERDIAEGQLEATIHLAASPQRVVVRNLGWAGDTVWADSRGVFDAPEAGYQRTLELLRELKPTQVWCSYGRNEMAEVALHKHDAARVAQLRNRFVTQRNKLFHDIEQLGATVIWVPPIGLALPCRELLGDQEDATTAALLAGDAARSEWIPDLDGEGRPTSSDARVVLPLFHRSAARLAAEARAGRTRTLLDRELSLDGATLTAEGYRWAAELLWRELRPGQAWPGTTPGYEAVRAKVVEKNTLWFHRWRPQNITYLALFRKHEQGNNLAELKEFDAPIAQLETMISDLTTASQ